MTELELLNDIKEFLDGVSHPQLSKDTLEIKNVKDGHLLICDILPLDGSANGPKLIIDPHINTDLPLLFFHLRGINIDTRFWDDDKNDAEAHLNKVLLDLNGKGLFSRICRDIGDGEVHLKFCNELWNILSAEGFDSGKFKRFLVDFFALYNTILTVEFTIKMNFLKTSNLITEDEMIKRTIGFQDLAAKCSRWDEDEANMI